MAVIVNGDGILTGISSLATSLTDITSGRGTVTGVATVGTLQLGAGVSISSPRTQTAAIFTNNTEFLTIDDAGRVGVGTITPNSDAHPENEKKINVGFVTAKSVAGDIDARNVVVAGVTTFVDDVKFDGATAGRDITFDRSDNQLEFEDNAKAAFGTGGADMQIYSDSFNPIIYAGTNTLRVVADNIHLEAGDFGDEFLRCTHDGGVALYYDNSLKFTTSSDGITVTGTVNADALDMGDDERVKLGTSDDLQVYHDGSNSYLKAISGGTGDLYIFADGKTIYLRPKSGEDGVKIVPDGAVEIYNDNVKVFSTTGAGIQVQAPEGSAAAINLYSDEGDDNADMWRIINNGSNFLKWQTYSSGSWQDAISAQGENQVRLFYNGSEKLNTGNHGISITGKIYMNNGNLQFASSSNGIDFSSTSDASGMTSELFDDYEEGTWTPAHGSSGGSGAGGGTYNNQYGTYTKVGNRVHISCYLGWNGDWSGGGGNYAIDLPFTQNNSPATYAAANIGFLYHSGGALSSSNEMVGGYVSTNKLLLYRIPTGQASGAASGGNVGNATFSHSAGYIQFNITMRV